jgi:hypothetical protein
MLHIPINVGGKDIILLPDVVVNISNPVTKITAKHVLTEELSLFNAVSYVAEKDIFNARSDYPNIAVYGLWQTLVSSDLVDSAGTYFVSPNGQIQGKDSASGLILVATENFGKLELSFSDVVKSGFSSVSDDFDFENVKEIILEDVLNQLVIPISESKTRKELFSLKKEALRKSWMVVGFICVFIAVSFSAYWLVMEKIKKDKKRLFDRELTVYEELREQADYLKSTRAVSDVNLINKIDQLLVLIYEDRSIFTEGIKRINAAEGENIANSFTKNDFLFGTNKSDASSFYNDKKNIEVTKVPGQPAVIRVIFE